MGTTKCRIPLGMFYGHTTVLPSDIRVGTKVPDYVPVLSPGNIQAHLSVLSYLVEDIGCRYQLACSKLRKLLEPLLKPEISALDHISYYLPKGKERNKLGLNNSSDQVILSSYQVCYCIKLYDSVVYPTCFSFCLNSILYLCDSRNALYCNNN